MRRTGRSLGLLLASGALAGALLWAGPAEAGGTHFLVQLQAGLATPPLEHLDLSVGYGAEIGYGGRLAGTPVRFYGVAGFDRAAFSATGLNPHTGARWASDRSYNDIQVGLRVLVPVVWQLRWYLDLMAGGSFLEGSVEREGADTLTSSGWAGLFVAGTGFELRWARSFATGVRGELRWLIAEADALAYAVGDAGEGSLRFTVLVSQSVMF